MMNTFPYPYFQRDFHSPANLLPPEIAEAVTHAGEPVIEIGGPTLRGFRLLQDTAVLSMEPSITNIIPLRGTHAVMDGTRLDIQTEAVGLYLASNITSHVGTPASSLRKGILREMGRTLRPGGLAVFEMLDAQDVTAATDLGFVVLHQSAAAPYDCVFQRP